MSGERILVVEDTELLRTIYRDKLVQQGYRVTDAPNGLEALRLLRSEPFDLVLLDLIMPTMSGLEALSAIKADPRTSDVPVVILSNLGDDDDVQRGLSMGAVDYLIKNSARPADVTATIKRALEQQTAAAEGTRSFKLAIKDRVADADRFVEHAKLARRFWCPACEVELALELVPKSDNPGWYDAHLVCPMCGRES